MSLQLTDAAGSSCQDLQRFWSRKIVLWGGTKDENGKQRGRGGREAVVVFVLSNVYCAPLL